MSLLCVSHKNLWMFQNQQPLNPIQYVTILGKRDRSKLNYTWCWTAVPCPLTHCKLSKSLQHRHFNERIICSDDYKTPDFAHTVYEYTGPRVHLWVVYLTTVIIQSNKWLKMTNEMQETWKKSDVNQFKVKRRQECLRKSTNLAEYSAPAEVRGVASPKYTTEALPLE